MLSERDIPLIEDDLYGDVFSANRAPARARLSMKRVVCYGAVPCRKRWHPVTG